jgi:hypothetical protein
MKLKATQKRIFTLNESLKELDFDKYVEVKINSICNRIFIGKISNEKSEFEHIQITYKPESIDKLKYLYHIKILGAGLQYKHLAYVKATFFQHIQIWFVNRFIKFITNFENIFKILTVFAFTIPFFLNTETNVNVYVSEPKINNVIVDTTKNTVNFTDTTKFVIDSVTTKIK